MLSYCGNKSFSNKVAIELSAGFFFLNRPISTRCFDSLWHALEHTQTKAQIRQAVSHLYGMKIIMKQRQVKGVCCVVHWSVCVISSFQTYVCAWAADWAIWSVNVDVWLVACGRTHTHIPQQYSPVPLTANPPPLPSEAFRKECEAISDVSEGFCLSGPDTLCKYSRQVGGFSYPK